MLLREFPTPNVKSFLLVFLSPKDGIFNNSFIRNFTSLQILRTAPALLSRVAGLQSQSQKHFGRCHSLILNRLGTHLVPGPGACFVSRWCPASLPTSYDGDLGRNLQS